MQTLSQTHQLLQKLTPQQVQYLKMLQLPIIALEQRIKEELETNPLLEEGEDAEVAEQPEEKVEVSADGEAVAEKATQDDSYTIDDFIHDETVGYKTSYTAQDSEEREEMPLPDQISLSQRLTE